MMNYKIFNWDKFNRDDEVCVKHLGMALGRFFSQAYPFGTEFDKKFFNADELVKIQNLRNDIQKVQNLADTTDFPEFLNDLQKRFLDLPVSDIAYRAIFDIFPLNGTDGWDIMTETSDINFEKILPGGRINYYTPSGSKYRSYVDYYGAGVGVDQRLIDSRSFIQIERFLTMLRSEALLIEATVAYALIEAVGAGQNIAWQAPDPAAYANTQFLYTASRDANTMNLAATTLIANNVNKAIMPNGLRTNFIILAPYQLQKRLMKALDLRLQSVESSQKEVIYNFTLMTTTLLTSAIYYYVIIPKGKNTGGNLLNLTQFNEFNQTNYTNDIANWLAFGYDIGDEEQFQRCLTA